MEAELVRRAQHGDREAFRGLVELYGELAGRTAHVLLRDPPDAEDAVQEAWVDAWRAMPRFETEKPFRPWLLTLVANRCRMKARQRKLQTTPYSDESAGAWSKTPRWAGMGTEYDAELHEALDVPEDSFFFYASVGLEGSGKVWVDNVRFEVVDNDVPLTNAKP